MYDDDDDDNDESVDDFLRFDERRMPSVDVLDVELVISDNGTR
jgi:hypothetical protein